MPPGSSALHRQKIRDELRRDIYFFSPCRGSHPIIAAADVGSRCPAWHFSAMTDASADDLALAAEFPAATQRAMAKARRRRAQGRLIRGQLVTETYDGIRIEPLSLRKRKLRRSLDASLATPWTIMQRIDHPQSAAANARGKRRYRKWRYRPCARVRRARPGAYGYGLASRRGGDRARAHGIDLGFRNCHRARSRRRTQ